MDSIDPVAFFRRNFADVLEAIREAGLLSQFYASPTAPLVTIACDKYRAGNAVLLDDAAHAMVPFYSQGRNVGFEDAQLLSDIFQTARQMQA